MLLTLLACEPDAPPAETLNFCESATEYAYDPEVELETFPDDWWTVEDPTTATGLRVALPEEALLTDDYGNLLSQLNSLDGFGLTPAIILRFHGIVDPAALEVRVLAAVDGGWEEHPSTLGSLDGGYTVTVAPWTPLPPASRVVVAVRSDATDPACVSPSPTLRGLLTGEGRLADRYAEGLDALGWAPEEVGAMVVYTTQSVTADAAVAADIAARDITLDAPMTCTDGELWRDCEGTVTVGDYRASDRVVPEGAPAVQDTYALPLTAWVPKDVAGPWPVVLCGHGLAGDRFQCDFLADFAAPLGIAVLAVDAQESGDHPARTAGDDELEQIMALFGFTLSPPSLDALVMRDNFRASAWDKLQILRAVELGMDLDGDGTVDLDATRVQYAGASLGGIMAPEVLAWAPSVDAGLLAVPGGGLMNLVLDSDTFGIIATAMTPDGWNEDDLHRAIPMVQTLIDAGDPLVHAAALTRARTLAPGPDLALLMAVGDTIVPNSSTAALAAALGVEGIGDDPYPMPGVTYGTGPLAANLADGATGGVLQLVETQPEEGADWEPADHSSLHESVQAREVMEPFFLSVNAGETPSLAFPE